jgi:hypothetical protein
MGKVKKPARKVYTPGSSSAAYGIRHMASLAHVQSRHDKEGEEEGRVQHGRQLQDTVQTPPQDLLTALKAVREKQMRAREAAKKFEVPRTILQDRLSKISGPRVGCLTELSLEEEEINGGYTVRKMDLILRSIERMLQTQLSMARRFKLQVLRRYNVKFSKMRNFTLETLRLDKLKSTGGGEPSSLGSTAHDSTTVPPVHM